MLTHTDAAHWGGTTLWGGCFDKGFMSLPKDLKHYSHKKPQINRPAYLSKSWSHSHDTIHRGKWIQTPSECSFQTNKQCFEGGKRKMRSIFWAEKKVKTEKCHVLPQGKSACMTSKVKQVTRSKKGGGSMTVVSWNALVCDFRWPSEVFPQEICLGSRHFGGTRTQRLT